jgi:hypothetical protein
MLMSVLLLATGVAAQDDMAARAREVLTEAGCQPTLEGSRGSRRGERPIHLGGDALGGLAEVLLWGVVAGAFAWIVASVVRARRDAAAPATARPPHGRSVAPAAPAAAELPDHARLAADGDFAGALQALLRHAFANWSTRSGAVPVHATAREVLRRARNVVRADSLAHLVAAVERVRFGGQLATREQYDDALPHLASWEDVCRKR